MRQSLKLICFIPAKLSSTRLKEKNILKINGKELIYYPIKAAKETGLFGDNIFLSTESHKIKKIAIKYGAKVPYLRNKKLSHDPYGVSDVLLEFFEKQPEYKSFDIVVILLPTFPMILSNDIKEALTLFIKGKFKTLMSVTEMHHNTLRSVYVRDYKIVPLFADKISKKYQELEKTYTINGAITIIKIKDFLIAKNYFIYPIGAYNIPIKRSVDIDTKFDYMLAKFLMENKSK
jgi:CMP-N-acetylneuraminic acid synthetase